MNFKTILVLTREHEVTSMTKEVEFNELIVWLVSVRFKLISRPMPLHYNVINQYRWYTNIALTFLKNTFLFILYFYEVIHKNSKWHTPEFEQ